MHNTISLYVVIVIVVVAAAAAAAAADDDGGGGDGDDDADDVGSWAVVIEAINCSGLRRCSTIDFIDAAD